MGLISARSVITSNQMVDTRWWLHRLFMCSWALINENGDLGTEMGTQKLKEVPMGTGSPKWGPMWPQCLVPTGLGDSPDRKFWMIYPPWIGNRTQVNLEGKCCRLLYREWVKFYRPSEEFKIHQYCVVACWLGLNTTVGSEFIFF